ncbi:MAG: hypothetical protein QOJ02_1643 [Acidobacteriota bacterium]|jgi:hypothetical protein|nr:hypothetical protein [Acidobacteriota bacterium]
MNLDEIRQYYAEEIRAVCQSCLPLFDYSSKHLARLTQRIAPRPT